MRIVLDTNVFISGIFFTGPPSQILTAWRNHKLQIVLSKEILDEYQKVARELSAKFPSVDILPIIGMLSVLCELVDTRSVNINACDDPDDNKFIECAVAGKCKLIVSGDKHLLKVSYYKGVTVLNPRSFVEKDLI